MEFDQDRFKLEKHGVSFDEAQSVFYDEFAIQFFDNEESSRGEDRFLMLGMSHTAQVLLVCHCERNGGNIIRIISARKSTAAERRLYRKGVS